MKKTLLSLSFVSLITITLVFFVFARPASRAVNSSPVSKGFAVVELFTSEGCSSCPPADKAVAALVKDHPSNVFVLSFHVDYWNYLGWKDAFSSADYSKRQEQYAAVFQLNSIYTPQVVVNGAVEFTGSDEEKLHASVEAAFNNQRIDSIELKATATTANNIAVQYKTNAASNSVLQIALVQSHAVSEVKRGENKGKQLAHADVVRYFSSVNSNAGSISIPLPEGLLAKDCKVIAFAQRRDNKHITGAAQSDIK